MDNTFPAPLTPADCDLKDFAYMPLDVARLRQSEMASDECPEACWAAVLLWCASWHEIPAGSIPDNDQWQAKQAGYVARGKIDKAWETVRAGALRGFVKCADGRLYHPVVAEKACESWESKQRHAHGKMAERMRKLNKQRAEQGLLAVQIPTLDAWISGGKADPVPPEDDRSAGAFPPEGGISSAGIPPEKTLKGEGKGEGEGKGIKKRGAKAPLSAEPPTWMQDLIGLWHEVLPELPGVVVINDERKKAAADFRAWVLTTKRKDGTPRATSDAEFLDWSRAYFERARGNDFIMGRGFRSPEHQNWRCSFEYLLSAKGMQKVIEQTEEAPA